MNRSERALSSILEAVGDTPVVRLSRLTRNLEGTILAKLEYLNPGFSKKDRIALRIVEDPTLAIQTLARLWPDSVCRPVSREAIDMSLSETERTDLWVVQGVRIARFCCRIALPSGRGGSSGAGAGMVDHPLHGRRGRTGGYGVLAMCDLHRVPYGRVSRLRSGIRKLRQPPPHSLPLLMRNGRLEALQRSRDIRMYVPSVTEVRYIQPWVAL